MLIAINHVIKSKTCKLGNEYTFSYNKLHKGRRKGNSPVVRFCAYSEDLALCVVKCLDVYLQKSQKQNRQKCKSCCAISFHTKTVFPQQSSTGLNDFIIIRCFSELGQFRGHSHVLPILKPLWEVFQ